jgi:hypothetical protein
MVMPMVSVPFLMVACGRKESNLEPGYVLGRKSPSSGREVGARLQPPNCSSCAASFRDCAPSSTYLSSLYIIPRKVISVRSFDCEKIPPRFLESKKTYLEQLCSVARRLRPIFDVLEVPIPSIAFSLSRLGLVRQKVEVELLGVVLRLLDLAAEVEQIVGLQQVIGPHSVRHVALQESTCGEVGSQVV